ncbi:MAG TPA: TetR/AcrR family transcriptional regulator [Polyangiaceae bacterium]|nr:TetR/AcrR family transcriptional regulator [Polyangiaceae bacterium]
MSAILETAASCFSKGGFTATTLADIGRELGLRKSIVHYYFASKAALVHEVQSFAYGRYLDALRQGLSSGGDGLNGLWKNLKQGEALRNLNIELWSEGRRDPELLARQNVLQDEARRLLADYYQSEQKRSAAEADSLATLTLSVLDGLTVLADRDGMAERADRAFESFLALVAKR